MAYFDTKSGSLEEAIRQAVSGQINEKKNVKETNKNDKSDDGEGMDAVQPKAVKKKFDDRKDKDIDNDGDVDDSDKYLAKRRKAVSKAIAKEETIQAQIDKAKEFKIQDMKSALAQVWGMEEGKNPFKKEEEEKPVITKGGKTLTGKKPAEIDVKPKINKEA